MTRRPLAELRSETGDERVIRALENGPVGVESICCETWLDKREVFWRLKTLECSGSVRMNGQRWEIVRNSAPSKEAT